MKKNNIKEADKWFKIGNSEFMFAELHLDDKQNKFYA